MEDEKQRKTKFVPNSDRVLVKLDGAGMSSGGLYVPETAKTGKPRPGRVVSVGPGRHNGIELVRPPFEIDDKVVIDEIGGMKIVIDGEDFLLVRTEEILGTLEQIL